MKKPLTKKQFKTLEYLKSYQKKMGFMPTVDEIGKHFRRCHSTTWEILHRLEQKGYIRRKKHHARWITII